MAKEFGETSSLSDERSNEIAHRIAEHYVGQNFRHMSNGEYGRRLGQAAQELGVTQEELHSFFLSKLPKLIAGMFGWDQCSITGSRR